MRNIREIQEWLDANIVNRCDDEMMKIILIKKGFSRKDVNALTFRISKLGTNDKVYEFVKWLEEEAGFSEEKGYPHVYRIFFASGERHEVVADDVEFDDWEDEDGRVRRGIVFRLDGRIVAKAGDIEFVLLDPEERDDED